MGNAKKQHYIPQTYLKPFSFSDNRAGNSPEKSIWVYDKTEQEKGVKQKGITKICQESYYYSHKNENGEWDYTAENRFSKIEGNFAKIRDKIIKNCENYNKNKNIEEITLEERVHFLEFIGIQFLRVPLILTLAKQEISKGYKKYFPIPNETDEHLNNEVQKDTCSAIINKESLDRWTKALDIAKWDICIIPDNCSERFITNDNPVLTTTKDGKAMGPSKTIFLAITPKNCISLRSNKEAQYKYGYGHWSSAIDIKRFNFAMRDRAHRFVLSHDKKILESLIK